MNRGCLPILLLGAAVGCDDGTGPDVPLALTVQEVALEGDALRIEFHVVNVGGRVVYLEACDGSATGDLVQPAGSASRIWFDVRCERPGAASSPALAPGESIDGMFQTEIDTTGPWTLIVYYALSTATVRDGSVQSDLLSAS